MVEHVVVSSSRKRLHRHPAHAVRQTGRQTDRQTGRQTDRQTGRQTDRQTDRQTGSISKQIDGLVLATLSNRLVRPNSDQNRYLDQNKYLYFISYKLYENYLLLDTYTRVLCNFRRIFCVKSKIK